MMARFIDPHGGRDWEIELVNAGEGPDGGSTGAGRALTVSIVKRQAMMLLRGLRSAIDSEGHR
jgi:hypothetical protein